MELNWFKVFFTLFVECITLTQLTADPDMPPIFKATDNTTVGSNITLPCKNETNGEFFGVIWKHIFADGLVVEAFAYYVDTGYSVHKSIVDRSKLVNGTSLRIQNIRISDGGPYSCSIIYFKRDPDSQSVIPVARIKSEIDLVIVVPPNITSIKPLYQEVSQGKNATFTCNLQTIKYSRLTWRNDQGEIIKKAVVLDSGRKLVIPGVSSSDSGVYKCMASNAAGVREKYARLRVKVPPKISGKVKARINTGATGRIRCIAYGFPRPTFKWRFVTDTGNVISLFTGENRQKMSVLPTVYEDSSDYARSELRIKDVKPLYWKTYTCIAMNSEGSDVHNFSLSGFDYPAKPVITKVDTYLTKAVVFWKIPSNGGTEITSLTVQYKNSTQKTWKSIEIRPVTGVKHTISGLKPDTLYYFRIHAKNKVGTSPYSIAFPSRTKVGGNQATAQKQGEKGVLGSLGVTALIGIFSGGFLALIISVILIFLFVRKIQKTAASHTGSPPISRPVSMENGSVPVGKLPGPYISHYARTRIASQPIRSMDSSHILAHDNRRPSELVPEFTEMDCLVPKLDAWEFPRDRLRLSTVLGTGAFGLVMRGDAQGIRGSLGKVRVAVKMVKDSANETAKRDLYGELDLLKIIPEHPNVVGLLGCCTRAEPLMVIVEYCSNGDLQGFLRSSRGIHERYYRTSYGASVPNLTAKMLLTFAWQICRGMAHLGTLKVVHRDLASRNVLVDEHLVCKVGDFGFARDVYVEDHYLKKSQGGRFPIKWMAIEALLDGISTAKGDVWSFGVVLWEIVTLGASPYPGMNSYEVVTFLQDGYRMDKPKHCSDELYAVMMECWQVSPQRRPSFEELGETLRRMVDSNEKEFINMNYYQDHLYVNFDVNLTGGQSSNNNSTSNGHDSDFASLTGRRREVQRDSLGESFRESQRELRRNSEREVLRRNSEREVLRRNTPGTSERELFRRNSEREQLLRQESQRDAQHSENHVTTSAL